MAAKVIIFAFLGLLAIQGFEAKAINHDNFHALKAIGQKSIDFLDERLAMLDKHSESDGISEDVQAEIEKIKQAIREEIAKIKVYIDEWIKKAEEAGIEIEHCVEKGVKDLKSVPVFVRDEIIVCLNNTIVEFETIIQEALEIVMDTVDQIVNFEDHIRACITEVNPDQCVEQVINDAREAVKNLPNELKKKVEELREAIQGLRVKVLTCTLRAVMGARARVQAIAKNTYQCIMEAMPEN